MSKYGVLHLVCGLMLSGNALAMSGKAFLAQCSLDKLESLDKQTLGKAVAHCTALVQGVVEGHIATTAYYKKDRLFCIPQGKRYMELTSEVVARLVSDQEHQDQLFGHLAIIYLRSANPCEGKQ